MQKNCKKCGENFVETFPMKTRVKTEDFWENEIKLMKIFERFLWVAHEFSAAEKKIILLWEMKSQ